MFYLQKEKHLFNISKTQSLTIIILLLSYVYNLYNYNLQKNNHRNTITCHFIDFFIIVLCQLYYFLIF